MKIIIGLIACIASVGAFASFDDDMSNVKTKLIEVRSKEFALQDLLFKEWQKLLQMKRISDVQIIANRQQGLMFCISVTSSLIDQIGHMEDLIVISSHVTDAYGRVVSRRLISTQSNLIENELRRSVDYYSSVISHTDDKSVALLCRDSLDVVNGVLYKLPR